MIKNILIITILTSPIFLLSNVCNAQTIPSKYQISDGFKYLEVVDKSIRTNQRLPLLVVFHYSSSTPEEMITYYDSLSSPMRIILVKGNYVKRNGFSYFPPDHYSKDSITQMNTIKKTVDSLAVFVATVRKKYDVDPIVTGISQGGDISLLLAVHYPNLIKASIPLLGFIHKTHYTGLKAPKKRVPIYLFHGEADKIVSIEYVKTEFTFLKKDFNILLYSYPGVTHDVTPLMEKEYSRLLKEESKSQL